MITYTPSHNKPVRPKQVQFAILSDEEVKRMSVAKITETTLYYRGLPNAGGMNDALMGTCDRRLLCGTCMQDIKMCQGHIGHIEYPFPMYHIGFFDNVVKTLRMCCFFCSRICATDEDLHNVDSVGKNRFTQVYSMIKSRKKCPHCNMVRPNYSKSPLSIRIDWPSDMEWITEEERAYCTQIFTAREALSILTHVPDKDYQQMGFDPICSHPKNMIQTVLVVCPPVTRPAVTQSEGSRSRGQNDLTHKYQDIQKKCIELATYISDWKTISVTPDLHERIQKVQFEVFTLVNNSVRGQKQSTQRSGMPTKSLIERLKGKDGRIRGNLMGKRVDFSARSVITPCANMDIDHVGVPEKLALTLTISERVTPQNIEALLKRVRNGAGRIDGADSIVLNDGTVYQLEHCKDFKSISLKHGDIVERYLQDDDLVVFNRQPSLHRMSMLGHRVKIMPGLTFRLNVVCTSPYNADFDGDEMNLHVPRSQAAIADVATLMMVSQQIISPQSNKPVMGIVQDSLLGAHLLCQRQVFLDHSHACHACATIKHVAKTLGTPCIRIDGKPYWSGKQLLSILFPHDMTIDLAKLKTLEDDVTQFIVRRGQMLQGEVTKSVLGASAGGIVDVLCRDYGNVKAAEFMSDVQRLTNSYLLIRGFSVGVSDCILNEEGQQKVNERLEKATMLCEEISREMYQEGTPEEVARNAESTILRILSKTLMQTGSIVNDYMKENSIQTMVNCKSKGTPINLSQILGLVGQQSVEGGRINPEKGCRTLPYFGMTERSLSAQGFVNNSYALGLMPTEFFFHAMGGREGLSDTAVKTSVTGYIQRRQIKSMEDHKVHYDGTVRDALDGIVDFMYGGDNMDPVKLERVKLGLLEEHPSSMRKRMTDAEYTIAMRARTNLLATRLYVNMPTLDTRVLLPFHPIRLKQALHTTDDTSKQTGQQYAEDSILKLILKCDSNVLRATVIDFFCSSRMKNVVKEDFDHLMEQVEQKISSGRIHPGEMVGSLAAQSVGEPATQMSIRGDEYVLIRDAYGMRNAKISDVIDPLIKTGTPPVMQVMGVTSGGQVQWANVRGVSRHPANGIMLKVTTQTGRSVVATASHSFLTRSASGKVVPIRGDHLRLGDPVPIMKTFPPREEEARNLGKDLAQGYRVGIKDNDPHLVEWLIADPSRSLAFLQGLVEMGDNATVLVPNQYTSVIHMVCNYNNVDVQQIKTAHTTKFIFCDKRVQDWVEQIKWDAITDIQNLGNSDETVYDFTVEQNLESFMLSHGMFVHNTLNSVDWNTNMVIHWTDSSPPPAPQDAEVGAFIDALIEKYPNECQYQPDGVTIYLPLKPGTAKALSSDEDGNMMWTDLEAVTRHPPINKDGSSTLCKVTTEGGQEVIVTKGKSLLVEKNGKLVAVEGEDVRIGDRVPIVKELPGITAYEHLDLHTVFKETEVVFTNTMLEMQSVGHTYRWFKLGNFKDRSCYSRADSMKDAVRKRPGMLVPDMVVWPFGGAYLPMNLPLDRTFGFFIGAYLAEGCLTEHQVHIANVDEDFRNACKAWADQYDIKSHVTNENHQHKNNGTSISIMFHSTLLCQLLERTCGKTSYGKRVPAFAFAAPNVFVEGLVDGYISGDGTISSKQAWIESLSRSKYLRDGMSLLLSKFGITCHHKTCFAQCHVDWSVDDTGYSKQEVYGEDKPIYKLYMNASNTYKFAANIKLTLDYKQKRLDELQNMISKSMKAKSVMKQVVLDPIIKLEDTESSHEYVYDLTVAKTHNMTATNGFVLFDTFHFAGCAAKNVTLGIPRLKELLDVSKNPKTPSTTIRFKKPFSANMEFVTYFANTLPLTRLGDIVSKCEIVYDSDTAAKTLEDEWMIMSHEHLASSSMEHSSKCTARLQLNQVIMKTRHLTPPIVRRLLQQRLAERAVVLSSETNSVEWILRIRFARVSEMMQVVEMSGDREAVLCHRVISTLLDTVAICGHPNVKSAAVMDVHNEYLDKDGVLVREKEYAVSTLGSCLLDCSASPCVDWERTTSNDISEVAEIMGIEAAAAQLFEQLNTVVSFDGTYIDPRHLTMIVNTMCKGGALMALNRHGINRSDTGPLGKCSFEETPDVLCDAAMFAEKDNGRGVSTAIMTGQLARIGSGCTDILFNTKCLDPRDVHVEQKTIAKPWRSTCRSYTRCIPLEGIEYVSDTYNNKQVRAEEVQKPFSEADEEQADSSLSDEAKPVKRMRFRPRSPTSDLK